VKKELVLVPTGPGEEREIPTDLFESLGILCYFETDDAITCFNAAEPGRKPRGWMWTLSAQEWRPITPEGVTPM
jgi:hypothetical protein